MEIEFDPKKSERNKIERDLPFSAVNDFDFSTAQLSIDVRKNYQETRFVAVGFIGDRLHVVCYTTPKPDILRVISLRKANSREIRSYEKEKSNQIF